MRQAAPLEDPASVELHQILRDLFELELSICKDCYSAYGHTIQTSFPEGPEFDLMPEHRGRATAFIESAQQFRPVISVFSPLTTPLATALVFIVRLGETQTLMRWYVMRKYVLEKMQKREHLRSQLLMAQIMAISS